MFDVIFNGSADRAPRGFAEVCIVFRAGDGAFPGDYAGLEEIEISRRLHRTGASEYLINAVRVRRRDVQDVFLDTGVGVNLYSFIEQGRVDQLIQASPAERRVLFDQVAGIGWYRARREEAKCRLDDTCGQLDRAADVADEMGRRLALLNRQVGRVVRFKMLRGRVRYAEIVLGLVRYRELFQDRRALRERKTEAKGRLEALQGHVKERTAERDERRGEIEVLEGRVSALRDELAEVDAQRREQIGIQRLQADRSVELLGLAAQTERANDGTRSWLEEL
jgi:chromosome segregation protein